MISRALGVLAVVATAACGGRAEAPAPRERVLARIPAGVMAVIASDGRTLAHPRLRAVIDVLRPRWPARLGCAIDAALVADHVALGVTPARAAVLVLETRATVDCAALSQVAADEGRTTWVATLGGAAPLATAPAEAPASVLDETWFARARPFLATAPLALAIAVPGGTAIATATPATEAGDAAWLALDMLPVFADAAERHVRAYVERLAGAPATASIARALAVSRAEAQIVVRLSAMPADVELAGAVRSVLAWHATPRAAAPAFACPPLRAPVVRCTSGTRFEVRSLAAAKLLLIDARTTPVIANGIVGGLRLASEIPALGLGAGDVVVAAQGFPVTSRPQLARVLADARGVAHLTVTRDAASARLEIVGP